MKQLARRTAGAVAVFVGTAGVAVSVLAVVETWSLAGRLRDEVPEVLGQLSGIVEAVQRQGEATTTMLQVAREHVQTVDEAIEDFAGRDDPERAGVLETLDEDVARRLAVAEEFVVSMQQSMRSTSGTLLLLDSMPFLAPRPTVDPDASQSQLQAVAAGLNETADLLDQVVRGLAEIRAGRSVNPRQLARIRETLQLIDADLAAARAEVRGFTQRVARTGRTLERWKRETVPRIDRTAAAATAFFVCFACSQIALVLHGLGPLRRISAGDGTSRPPASGIGDESQIY